ncbi:hypothetical protein Hte_007085 [Hypoxylon texense]
MAKCSTGTIRESSTAVLLEILGSKARQTQDDTCEEVIRALLPYKLDNIASMAELKALVNSRANGVSDNEPGFSSLEARILHRLHRNIRGRSCHLTTDGFIILGPNMARKGDHVYVIPGCNVPLVLRQEGKTAYRIIGSCYRPEYANGEALLGRLPRGWRAFSDEGTIRYVNDEQKIDTLHDPRQGPLPPGWKERKLSGGGLGWYSNQHGHTDLIDFNPRLDIDALQARGIPIQEITLV